ncbi:hypothetical protein ACFV1L_10520 [Kitasatospora sp. NPDC059646]|uniref:hypothetical protein n=1 Tax=Kitasatospora sp. NPDC059646 TaxID=3346893 RepID=UPI0036BF10B5
MTDIRVSDPDSPGAMLRVERSVGASRLAFVKPYGSYRRGVHLDTAETRQLRDELNKLLGESPEPADGPSELVVPLRVSVVQDEDANDFARRSAAAEKARELLAGHVAPGSYGTSPQALMQLAGWLLGETD